jgi:hypothetical protein
MSFDREIINYILRSLAISAVIWTFCMGVVSWFFSDDKMANLIVICIAFFAAYKAHLSFIPNKLKHDDNPVIMFFISLCFGPALGAVLVFKIFT